MLDLKYQTNQTVVLPVGRITELNGLESSGKSLLGGHMLRDKKEGWCFAVYIDTETKR